MNSGSYAPAVLLHGFGDSPECWSPLIAAIDDDVVVTTPAAPGHAAEHMPDGVALDLPFLTDVALGHVEAAAERSGRPVVLGGHSMGAATGVAVAARRPDLVAALYLEDPPWGWPPTSEPDPGAAARTADLAHWIAGLQGSSHDDRVQWVLDHNPGWPRDEYDIWARAKAEVDPAVFAAPIDFGRFTWQPLVTALSAPATMLVGEPRLGSSCMQEVADYLAGLPAWTVIQVAGAGHDVRRVDRATAIAAFVEVLRAAA